MRVIEEQTREKPMRRTPNSFGVTVMTGPLPEAVPREWGALVDNGKREW